ncbi:hypothetical protein ANRL4_02438 [Anaerolineae bacterium]|nr:hypothetical protein ANRL4_02438 [Anaerolineae bacterium]
MLIVNVDYSILSIMDRELLLLGLLRRRDMHGYKLHEFIERDLAICTDLKKPTAYFLLDKMEKQGWISRHDEQDGKRPARRVYRLTDTGEEVFQRLLRQNLSDYHVPIFSTDAGLAFADEVPIAELMRLLEQKRAQIDAELAQMSHVPDHAGLLQLVIEHRRHYLETEARWLESILNRLNASTERGTES